MWDAEGNLRAPLLPNENGKPQKDRAVSSTFKGVVVEGRKFNDVLFSLLFGVMVAGMIIISCVGFSKGDPSRLIPTSEWSSEISEKVKGEYWFHDAVAHTKQDLPILGGAFVLAIVLGFVWLQLLRMFTKIFIYLTLALGIAGVIAGSIYMFALGTKHGESWLKILSYVGFAVAFLLVVAVIFLRKRIALTAALFTECCHGVQHNPSLFVIGLAIVVLFGAFAMFWISSFVYLYSVPGKTVQIDPKVPPKFDQQIRNLMYYQVFAFFWITSFMSAVFQMTVAGGVASWYFSRDAKGPAVGSPALKSLSWALSFSFGSLALGSLILAVVKFINFLLQQTKRANRKNKILVFIISCVQCLLRCIQGIVKFIDRFAYIRIAMYGEGFCTAAKNCFELISRNMFSAVVVDVLGQFVLFVGKLLGTVLCTMFTMAVVREVGRPISPITVTLVIVISYVIFEVFANIVGVGVDTVFVCYLEDLERNDKGSLYASPELQQQLTERAAKVHTKEAINN